MSIHWLGCFFSFFSLCTFLYLRFLCWLCGHWILTSIKVFLVRRSGLKERNPLSRHDDIQHTGPSRLQSRLLASKMSRNSKVPCCRSWSGRIGGHGICWSSHGSCCFSVGELGEAAISDAPSVVGCRLYQAVSVKKGHVALALLEGKSSWIYRNMVRTCCLWNKRPASKWYDVCRRRFLTLKCGFLESLQLHELMKPMIR